jgi:AraC family transcriptional regulator
MADRAAFTVLGVTVRGNVMDLDYVGIWEKQFMPRAAEILPLSTDQSYYGAYFGTDQDMIMDFIAGVEVAPGTAVPAGLVARELPAASYAVFACAMKDTMATWMAIMQEWMPTSGYEWDMSASPFEHYPPGFMGEPDEQFAIWVPVKKQA